MAMLMPYPEIHTYPDTQMVAATSQTPLLNKIPCQQQATDPVIQQLYRAPSHSDDKPAASKALSGVNLPFLDRQL